MNRPKWYILLLTLLLLAFGALYFSRVSGASSLEDTYNKFVYGELYTVRFALEQYLSRPQTNTGNPLAFALSLGPEITSHSSYKRATRTFDDALLKQAIGPLLQEPLAAESVSIFDVFPFMDSAVIEFYPEEVDIRRVLATLWSLYKRGVIGLWEAPEGEPDSQRLLSFINVATLGSGKRTDARKQQALSRPLWVDAPAAWSLVEQSTRTRTETIVAILDTGLRYDHQGLLGRLFTNQKEDPENDLDDDANGCTNDVHGCRFRYQDSNKSQVQRDWWSNRDFHGIKYNAEGNIVPVAVADRKGHGTQVAGVVAANWNQERGIGGVVGPADVKLLTLARMGRSNAALFSSLMASLQYVARFNKGEKKIRVLNFSAMLIPSELIPSQAYSPICRAMEKMPDVLFVVGAGNNRQNADKSDAAPTYPIACRNNSGDKLPNQIVVASFREKKNLYALELWGHGHTVDSVWRLKGSGYGRDSVDLAAPNEIWSPAARTNSEYRKFVGTSAAAPVVSGIAGMLLSLAPELSVREVKQILLDTVLPSTSKSFRIGLKTMGRVNACNAVARVLHEELGITEEESNCRCCSRHAAGVDDSCLDPEISTADYHDYFLREPCSCIVAGITNKGCCKLFFERFTTEESTDVPGFASWFKKQDFYKPEQDCS